MSDNGQNPEYSLVGTLQDAVMDSLLIVTLSLVGNVRFFYQSLKQSLAIDQLWSFTIPDNQIIRVAVTFAFWLVIGGLCYALLISAKSLLNVVTDGYRINHYINRPDKGTLLKDSIMRVLSWLVFVAAIALLATTMLLATVPSAKVAFASISVVNALTYIAYVLACVLLMRCVVLFSFVLRG